METTKQVAHPNQPGFVTTIKYLGRMASLKKMAQAEQNKKPYVVLDPRTNEPFIYASGPSKGEPMIVYKEDVSDDLGAIRKMQSYVVSFEGLTLHGAAVPFSPENLVSLLDSDLDVPLEIEIEEKGVMVKKTVPIPWATALERKANDRATFDADPQQPASAK